MGVNLFRIDPSCALELPDRFGELMTLLINQPELIARLGIMRIDGGGFQHAMKVLPAAQACTEAGELASEIAVRVIKEEGRGEISRDKAERPPEEESPGQRDPREEHDARGDPVLHAENCAHREEHEHNQIEQ